MAILDDSFREKADLGMQISSLKERLESVTEPAEREALQAEIQQLERVREARWPYDTGRPTLRLPTVDSGDMFTVEDAERFMKASGIDSASLRHIGAKAPTHNPKPLSEKETNQAAAWKAMRAGKTSLQRAAESTGEQARSLFQDALNKFGLAGKTFQQDNIKSGIAAAHALTGTAYKGRADLAPPEAREKELELAIGHLLVAIENYTEADNPVPWADAHSMLGEAFLMLSDAQPKNAAAAFQAALRVYKPETNHASWAKSVAGFGIAVGAATEAGALPLTWVSQSVDACRTALKELKGFPISRAYASSTLGRMLVTQISLESQQKTGSIDVPAHLEEAMQCLADALNTFTEEQRPFEWAEIHAAKAGAYLHKGLLAPPDAAPRLFESAVDAGTAALRVITIEHATGWANTHLILLRTYRSLASSEGCENVGHQLDKAIASIDAVLPVLGPELAALKANVEQQRAEITDLRSAI